MIIIGKFNEKTHAHVVADYYINEAIFADLASIFFEDPEETELPYSVLDLRLIIKSDRRLLIKLLDQMNRSLKSDETQAIEYFKEYTTVLRNCIKRHKAACQQLADLKGVRNCLHKSIHIC